MISLWQVKMEIFGWVSKSLPATFGENPLGGPQWQVVSKTRNSTQKDWKGLKEPMTGPRQGPGLNLPEITASITPGGPPWWLGGKEPACQCGRCETHGPDPGVGKIPWRRAWQTSPVFLPGESPGQGTLVGIVLGVTKSRTQLKGLSRHVCACVHVCVCACVCVRASVCARVCVF